MADTRLDCCMIATLLMLVLAAGVHAFVLPDGLQPNPLARSGNDRAGERNTGRHFRVI
jgi:hypothetical protein